MHEHGAITEPAIQAPTALVAADGKLNRQAVGWATQPIIDTSGLGAGRGRNKRWEYWNVVTPTHILAATVSAIDYACVPEVWVLDRETGKEWGKAGAVIPPRGAVLAASLEEGSSSMRSDGLSIDIDEVPGGTRIRAEIDGVSFDVVAELPEGHERLALVVPWSETRFQYTVKDVARPATGTLRIGANEFRLPTGESWAVLDHGRGRWPYSIAWNWGAGSGRACGRVIGVQVGARWTAGTGVSENAFFVDGVMHKIHGETVWEYDSHNWRRPWRVHGGGFNAVFTPFHVKHSQTNFGVLAGRTDQCFGEWAGTFRTAAGEEICFEGITGWAEDVRNRW
ncbi:DUF2804 domain-containing protein [Leucobacter sp. NPDC015123]|uniref:DUF2804 domain-containing protein n=1 Tax=Leucobacter sp. NPDC015123 TaxID=3364129 RepID=UPI0036F465F4